MPTSEHRGVNREATTSPSFLSTLQNTPCSYCDSGTLKRDEYKGNYSLVCDSCGTPGVQLF